MSTYGFTLIKEEIVPEVDGTARFYRHDKTGAQFLSISNNDINKCFGVNFRTPPKDSTGVAHILEHSVLCGSQKYTTKEPFVHLLKTSLQTFLNAMTYPDKTCYPVASTNTQDLYNLSDVYMDAVFFPRAMTAKGEDVFKQEGWHIDTSNGKWQFKGVVYNEMKGSYSSPDTILGEKVQQAIYPDTPYSYSSGGDPKHILDLSYEEFEEFHQLYYHPTNAYFYCWGDDDEQMRLKRINDVISQFDKIEVNSSINLQKKFDAPKKVEAYFDAPKVDDPEKQRGHAMLSFLLTPVYEGENNLLFKVLDHILMGLSGSVLRKALIDSGLGEDVRGGLGDSLIQMSYSFGLRSIKLGKAEEMKELIMSTLQKLVNDGIEQKAIDAAINSIEFRLREGAMHMFSKGLMTMTQCLTHWLHDKDPIEALKWEDSLKNIKQRLANGEKIFEDLIKTYFLENKHHVLVDLLPSADFSKKNIAEEEARIKAIYDSLSDIQKKDVENESQRLIKAQAKEDSESDIATIPVLDLKDVEKQEKGLPIDIKKDKDNKVKIFTHELETNDIMYSKLICNLDEIPYNLLPLLPLYGRAITELGTQKSNFAELGLNISAYTGGIRNQTLFQAKYDSDDSLNSFVISAKSTKDKLNKLVDLLDEIIFDNNFDNKERFKQILIEEKSRVEKMLIPGGRTLAQVRLNARSSKAGLASELTQGVSYVKYIREIANDFDAKYDEVVKNFQIIHNIIFRANNVILDITANSDLISQAEKTYSTLLGKIQSTKFDVNSAPWQHEFLSNNEAFIVPSRVNYIGLGANLFEHGYKFHGSALVINRFIRTSYLWDRVRVIGGAYGCGLQFSKTSGTITFASYRDPQSSKSIEAYKDSANFLANVKMTERDLSCAIIGTIGEIDPYLLPEAKGTTALWRELTNETHELRQKMRDEVFSTKLSDFHDYAEYLQKALNNANCVSFGGASLEEYAKLNNWIVEQLL